VILPSVVSVPEVGMGLWKISSCSPWRIPVRFMLEAAATSPRKPKIDAMEKLGITLRFFS
jgi:hypothetical protein